MDKSTLLIHTTHFHPFLWNSESLALLYRAGYTNQYIYVPSGHLPPVLPKGVDIPVGHQQIPDNMGDASGIVRISNFMWLLDTCLVDDVAKRIDGGSTGNWGGIPAPTWPSAAILYACERSFDNSKMTVLPHHTYEKEDMMAVFGESWVDIGGMLDFITSLRAGREIQDTYANRVKAGILQVSFATQPQEIVDKLIRLDATWRDKSMSLFNFLQGVRIAP